MTDTKELRKLAEEATVICVKCGYNGPSEPAHLRPVGGTLCDYSAHKTVLLLADQLTGLLDTIEAQAAEIEELKASTITHCEWYAARNQITHQAALLKQCKGVLDYYKYDPMTEHARLHEALAAIEQYEQEYGK